MNKLYNIFETKKVEIWKFLKEIKTMLEIMISVLIWFVMIVAFIFYWGMDSFTNKFIDFVAGEPLYIKVMSNMVLIPLKFCFVLWIIKIFVGMYMRFIVSKMNESEKISAGIISFFKSGRKAIRKCIVQNEKIVNVNKVNKDGECDGNN